MASSSAAPDFNTRQSSPRLTLKTVVMKMAVIQLELALQGMRRSQVVSGAWRTHARGLVRTWPRDWSPLPRGPCAARPRSAQGICVATPFLPGPSWKGPCPPTPSLTSLPLLLVFPLHPRVFLPFLLLTLLANSRVGTWTSRVGCLRSRAPLSTPQTELPAGPRDGRQKTQDPHPSSEKGSQK